MFGPAQGDSPDVASVLQGKNSRNRSIVFTPVISKFRRSPLPYGEEASLASEVPPGDRATEPTFWPVGQDERLKLLGKEARYEHFEPF
jgi:hypothetical protein